MCAGQTCGDAMTPPLTPVLTKNDHSTIGGQQLIERGIDRLGECARPGLVHGLMATGAATVSATRTGLRGAMGAMTSAAELSRGSCLSR